MAEPQPVSMRPTFGSLTCSSRAQKQEFLFNKDKPLFAGIKNSSYEAEFPQAISDGKIFG